ncbi:isoprenyl transferase [Candidatus Aerophobetes bacterium]|nr:isoprenyl transferase [Candidatus Aerophobetes bacterium]
MNEGTVFSEKIPTHLAIIMDGNGRWAKQRGLPRTEGHRVGMEKIREIMDICQKKGIKVLTLYAFSKQNWNRPKREVNFLMKKFENYLDTEVDTLMEKRVNFRVIGRVKELPFNLRKKIKKVMDKTKNNRDFFLNLAINYGGQEEIVDAVKIISRLVKESKVSPRKIDVEFFKRYLYTPDLPYPDLLIRTGGEFRVSNFLLWQIAYTEFWVTKVFWPDFKEEHLEEALIDFAKRERRFGAIKEE